MIPLGVPLGSGNRHNLAESAVCPFESSTLKVETLSPSSSDELFCCLKIRSHPARGCI